MTVPERIVDKKLRLAVSKNKFTEVASLVLRYKANPNQRDGELFAVCAALGYTEMILWLFKLGGDLPTHITRCISELQARGFAAGAKRLTKEMHKLELEGKMP